ncbi:MAG: hypothetical protein QOF35_478 [Actinomycetota bacterium]|jgi:xanthosine utilization system XapX-like protein|nr:hypothetical protein [Actinomycetota bacterium]
MDPVFQLVGLVAIVVGFIGAWLAVRQPAGWLIAFTSAGLWVAPLATGAQWAGVANCLISMAISARNYNTARRLARPSGGQPSRNQQRHRSQPPTT